MEKNDGFRNGIAQHAVLYKIDAEKGEGIDLAREYRVTGYPTFILVDADGETYDRWLGYGNPEAFTDRLAEAATDPITVSERRKRFRKDPQAADARKIGELEHFSGLYGEALAWYERAEALGGEDYLAPAKLEAIARGHRSGLFDDAALMEQARTVIEDRRSNDQQVVETVMLLDRSTRDREDRGDYLAALKMGTKRLKRAKDEEGRRMYAMLMTDRTLLVDGKKDKAYAWKLKSMDPDWREDGNALNNVAWWCFEHDVALDEAEEYARKAIELTDGAERANVMDTLAEICNAKGDCGEALELIKSALELNPDSEYLQKQLARFEELFKQQQG